MHLALFEREGCPFQKGQPDFCLDLRFFSQLPLICIDLSMLKCLVLLTRFSIYAFLATERSSIFILSGITSFRIMSS